MTRFSRSLILCMLCISLFPLSAGATKHALLIGIAEYGNSGFADLEGTLNDIHLVREMLLTKFAFQEHEIRSLTDAEATHEGIRRAFEELTMQVEKDDQVYIHYSGHGSYTPDLNGDETAAYIGGRPYDSTWVSFGSRPKSDPPSETGEEHHLNAFDILDDELNAWLAPIHLKTPNVTVVSDSCHSGSVTRGNGPRVRAAPVDMRHHPLGKQTPTQPPREGVYVGAARDDQQAGEYMAPDGRIYGLFTWHWVKALSMISPGESWGTALQRTRALIGNMRITQQHPQITGHAKRTVFRGDFAPIQPTVSISGITGARVELCLGTFSGITKGSTYRKTDGTASFIITSARSFSSRGKILEGNFEPGDLAREEIHAYPYEPLKIHVRANSLKDAAYVDRLRTSVQNIPGYTLVANQKEADLLMVVTRPQKEKSLAARDILPEAAMNASMAILILDATGQPIHKNLYMAPASEQEGITLVRENLKKFSRTRELQRLGVTGNRGEPTVDLLVTRYRPETTCESTFPICLELPDGDVYRQTDTLSSQELDGQPCRPGELFTFRVRNTCSTDLYCYLINISDSGEISVTFPDPLDSAETVLVQARQERDFIDIAGFLIEKTEKETFKLIASQLPLDVSLFTQASYRKRSATQNPLEDFLVRTMRNETRGRIRTRPGRSKWGTVQFSVSAENIEDEQE